MNVSNGETTSGRAAPTGRCLVAMSDEHLETFFGGGLLDEMRASVRELRHVTTKWQDDPLLHQAIGEFQPDILVGAWSTPTLQAEDAAPRGPVRYFCNTTGGVRRVAAQELVEGGLIVSNWGSSLSRLIAEAALMMILASLKRAVEWHDELHHRKGWASLPTPGPQLSLFQRKVGIHGFGKIARELVRLLEPFKVEVSSFCEPLVTDEQLAEYGVRRAGSLEELFASNSVVVELEGLTDKSRGSVNEAVLRQMQPDSVLVNVGRGAVIDEPALYRVLEEGQIRVALDVFEPEPPPADSPLRNNPRVLLMPHMAGIAAERMRDAGVHALRNVQAYMAGKPLNGLITPELYPFMT